MHLGTGRLAACTACLLWKRQEAWLLGKSALRLRLACLMRLCWSVTLLNEPYCMTRILAAAAC